ncbi:hypothetical protein [Aurantimonas sp. A3-2-R12]|uniref:hypothetical protein n=1 Tax=Aurantimonas sp. A3-2-R12 TaxID=3114362 RepID=UPI002E18F1BD|nr:hypothetical protein [Aurantimonas sp. A3-2-R12]
MAGALPVKRREIDTQVWSTDMDERTFFNAARAKPFGGSLSQDAVDDMKAIIATFGIYGDGDGRNLAYILGTAFHESDRFKAMEEYASGKAYEGRRDELWPELGDGADQAAR